ncbi:pyruvate ferredoxin oxidoreductase subunit gamma [Archaeoglobus veneficus]|uniref:pyruvate synthase n=1 Tax=Archaeoglobus veneficus (strain DSM 11195 / SNP6) TaxID=693661 RepID=F2KML5_ARCVS|nr:pyruvate ferredoxin oxidoreductase subunit gamma [Archaeoglobus veneficus]AEA47212.1 pyruvate/ketoisovalerate oxidoreductase, gamma subunit [Archaeoglobus veneficus SNP6]
MINFINYTSTSAAKAFGGIFILLEVRFHGRGGQGVVTSADVLAVAAFKEGYYTLSFPTFGAEKRGTPVASFLRVSDKPIVLRDEIYNPDYVVVLDPTVMESVNVVAGLKENGMVIANYPSEEKVRELLGVKAVAINATKLAIEYLGRPITNTVMVGAFAGITGLVKLETLKETIVEWFKNPAIAEKNATLVEIAYKEMEKRKEEIS